MRKAILMMLLAGVNSSAAAEWAAIDEAETSTVYADAATIRKAGNMVRMWSLYDFTTPQSGISVNEPFLSMSNQYEYDCKDKRLRIFAVSFHSGNMAKGKVIKSATRAGDWKSVAPGAISDLLWKIACGKR